MRDPGPRWKNRSYPLSIAILLGCTVGLCLLLTRARAETLPHERLPKIRVSPAGRGFVTETGRPFVPFGITYYRPRTGWAPQVWKQFDPAATRKDFARMKDLGINCVRVFLSYGSFYTDPGVLKPDGLQKFDEFLNLAEEAGIYVHPTGLDHWEGPPHWTPASVSDARTLDYTVEFWKLFAARYRGRHVLFAYDLRNEPNIGWDDTLVSRWNAWLEQKYAGRENIAIAWGQRHPLPAGPIPVPEPKDALDSRRLLDFQSFRESLADEWTRRQAQAIKAADPEALVTVGFLQSSVPFGNGIREYTGFRPERQARFLDFLEIHFYPLARGAYDYQHENDALANLAYLENVVRETARPGKPVVLAEFGWYGGGRPRFDNGRHPAATEAQQADFLRREIQTSAGFVTGWLNWGLHDEPDATDCSELTGLLTADGKVKAWGRAFARLSKTYGGTVIPAAKTGPRPVLNWNASLTSSEAAREFRDAYLRAFIADKHP